MPGSRLSVASALSTATGDSSDSGSVRFSDSELLSEDIASYTPDDWAKSDVTKLGTMFNVGIPHFRWGTDRKQKALFNERISHWGTYDDKDDLFKLLSTLTMRGYDNLDAVLTGCPKSSQSRIRESMTSWAQYWLGRGPRSRNLPIQKPQKLLTLLHKRLRLQPIDHGKTNMSDACTAFARGFTSAADYEVHRESVWSEAMKEFPFVFSKPERETSPSRSHVGPTSERAPPSADSSGAAFAEQSRRSDTINEQSSWASWKVALSPTTGLAGLAGLAALGLTGHVLYRSLRRE